MHKRRLGILIVLFCAVANASPGAQRASPQQRPHGTRVVVDASRIDVDDGDSIVIRWGPKDEEVVRILGIDTPETRHLEHNIPYDQSQGLEALAFARGAFAAATEVQLLRAATLDPYGRSLAYVFINGRNYSVMVLRAHLAYESVTQFGDNGFPAEASAIVAAAQSAGPPVFEPPHLYRARMAELSKLLKAKGIYPTK